MCRAVKVKLDLMLNRRWLYTVEDRSATERDREDQNALGAT